jgi:NitT/TauT family transport system substrate-binding protein
MTLGSASAAQPLRLGILPVVDTLPLIAGQEEGLFAKAGIDLELVPFQSALERDAALQAGRLDGYFGDLLNSILLIHSGLDLRILTTAYRTRPEQRMFGIVAAPGSGIQTLAQLKGRAVAISRTTVIEYLLEQLLKAQRLPMDYVTKQEIKKIPIRLQMVLGGQVPAALLPEPLLTLAEAKGARVIADDRQLNLAETVVALRQARLSRDDSLAGRFKDAYRQAVQRINQHPEAYKSLLIQRTRFPKIIENQFTMPRFPESETPSRKDVEDVQDWLKAKGAVQNRIPYAAVVMSD